MKGDLYAALLLDIALTAMEVLEFVAVAWLLPRVDTQKTGPDHKADVVPIHVQPCGVSDDEVEKPNVINT